MEQGPGLRNLARRAANGRLGAAADGTNGLVGHILEGINERIVETDVNIGRVNRYLSRRYDALA